MAERAAGPWPGVRVRSVGLAERNGPLGRACVRCGAVVTRVDLLELRSSWCACITCMYMLHEHVQVHLHWYMCVYQSIYMEPRRAFSFTFSTHFLRLSSIASRGPWHAVMLRDGRRNATGDVYVYVVYAWHMRGRIFNRGALRVWWSASTALSSPSRTACVI